MKCVQLILAMIFFSTLLCALEVPYSDVPIRTDNNKIIEFLRIDPDDKKTETLPTTAWLWHDTENLYVEVQCSIDSTFTQGSFAQRDGDSKGDYLFLYLITNPQTRYAYQYTATPSGSIAEGVKDINWGTNYDWNSSYSYQTEHNDTLWTVVFQLPFKDMRFQKNPPYKWRFRLTRYNEKNREYYSFPYYKDNDDKDFFEKALDITLSHKIVGKKDWKFRPYFVKSYDLVSRESTFDPENVGLDISFNPSTKTKLKLTLNPDFNDVPPDDAYNIYNDRYPSYYSENRFFFIEDIDAFGVDSDMFYTRRIVQPQVAVKFTGNHNAWNYGYLAAKDKKLTDDGYLVNPDDFYQLASILNKGDKHQVSFSTASKINSGNYNHFGRGYWSYEFIKNLTISSSHLISTKFTEGDSVNSEVDKQGMINTIGLNATPGNWSMGTSYSNIQKDVTLDMGYLYETGAEGYNANISWFLSPREKYLRSMSLYASGGYSNGLEPNKPFKEAYAVFYGTVGFLPKYFLMGSSNLYRVAYLGKEHDVWNVSITTGFSRWQAITPIFYAAKGTTVIYSLNETKDFYTLRFNSVARIGQRFVGSIILYHYEYGYDKLNYIYTPTDTLVFKLDNSYQIANASITFNFSNEMTIRNGLSISTYKTGSTYSNVSFYSNFRYEFKKDWYLYLGYKTRQLQDEPSTASDWLGSFKRNSASAYLKISATI